MPTDPDRPNRGRRTHALPLNGSPPGTVQRVSSAWLLVPLLLVAIVVLVRTVRLAALDRLRADWGSIRRRAHDLDAIAESHASRVRELGERASLDDRTWADLNMDDVFAALDRTESTLGQHALYHRLRSAPAAASLDAFEALVARLGTDEPVRTRVRLALGRLQNPRGYDLWWLARPDAVDAPAWYVIFPVLTVGTIALAAATLRWPTLLPVLLGTAAFNVLIHFATFQRVGATSTPFRQLAPLIATAQALGGLEGPDIDAIVEPLRRDTPSLVRLKTISRWICGDPLMLSVNPNPLAMMASDGFSAVYEYLNFALPIDASGLYIGAADLRRHGAALLRVMAAIGDVDAAVSVASLRAGRADWTRPAFLPPGSVAVVHNARHPLLDGPVPNSIDLPAGRGVLVTGSNMSGKSTFLRTIGTAAVLAQTIHTVFADEYAAPVFDVRSCIGRSDDLLAGKSYYVVEVEALLGLVARIADAPPCLFLLDELFRGTNAVERIAAGRAVLEELVSGGGGASRHVALAATHDGELVDLLAGTYSACHFGDAVTDDGLVFDHILKAGRATSRNAIALLRLHGAPSRLIDRALTTATDLDRQRHY